MRARERRDLRSIVELSCKYCGMPVENTAQRCPICGAPFNPLK